MGLHHYEGRNWRGFHHHASLCIAAYGFLMRERLRSKKNSVAFKMPAVSKSVRPRRSGPNATSPIPTRLPRWPSDWLGLSPEASHTARVAGSHRTNGFAFSNTVELRKV
ncbi:putative ISXo8 transposase [Xanthomonas oryzae pv. oryzae KACC 10331]|uniref:ISXo8 transposase n=1 Tax=Xanthomonas oryzae pv. oryzae (strain KACC10331 / KXO85) TaxID=291331 RepID=Q5H6U6_XANOR|nr:putative ISXo8 transposase [Xanthomonas oryzae pv. oryzae KACC 10331]